MSLKHYSKTFRPYNHNFHFKLSIVETYLEGQVLDVLLYRGVTPSAPNQSLGIKDGVLGVRGQLILGSITNQTLTLTGEGDI